MARQLEAVAAGAGTLPRAERGQPVLPESRQRPRPMRGDFPFIVQMLREIRDEVGAAGATERQGGMSADPLVESVSARNA